MSRASCFVNREKALDRLSCWAGWAGGVRLVKSGCRCSCFVRFWHRMEQLEAVFVPFFGAGGGAGSSFRKKGWGRAFAGGPEWDGLTLFLCRCYEGPGGGRWDRSLTVTARFWAVARFAVLGCA